ncbi:MAG: hypothetical protein ACHQHN_16635 [Sphingobacteriales bacterium]
MKKIYIFITSLIVISSGAVNAQQQLDPLKENVTYNIDNLGNGHIELNRKFNASQWDNYKKIVGNNAEGLWKRAETRNFPSAYLENFNYKEEDQSFTLTFDALGLAKINDNGQWQIDINIQKPDINKISDRNFAMTASYNTNGALMQDLIKVNMPDGAANVTQDKDAFGKPIFTYDLTPGHGGARLLFLIAGILFMAAGAVFYFKPDILSSVSKPKVKPFTVVSAQQAPAATPEPSANPNIEKQA